jgi:hypothetical protein
MGHWRTGLETLFNNEVHFMGMSKSWKNSLLGGSADSTMDSAMESLSLGGIAERSGS